MPVLWCLNNYDSCNRLVSPGSVLYLRVLLVGKSVRKACSKVRNESHILESIACSIAGMSKL